MELKLYHTTNSKLQSLPIVGGQLIVSRDDKTLRIDIDDVGRIEITDFIDIETDAQRLAVLAPLPNKYYYVANTNSVWRFVSGEWKKINNNTTYTLSSGSINGTIKLVGSDGIEIEVAVKGLGSAAFTDANDYAKKDNVLLLEEQTLTESQKTQVKNNLGISESGGTNVIMKIWTSADIV